MTYGGLEPSPQDVNQFHKNADTDSSPFAVHHTLGTKPNQAAAGNHVHKSFKGYWDADLRNFDGTAIAHTPVIYRYWQDEEWVRFILNADINATSNGFLRITLPVAVPLFGSIPLAIGYGRENGTTGLSIQIHKDNASSAVLFRADNNPLGINGYKIVCRGEYPLVYEPTAV